MMGFLRLALFGLIGLTLLYWLLVAYARSLRRERLERDYDEGSLDGDVHGPRDAYIAKGMAAYDHSLRRKLLWAVYVLPIAVVAAMVWLNFG